MADVDGKERLASRARVAASSLRFVGWAVIGHCGASVRRPFFSILLTDRPLFLPVRVFNQHVMWVRAHNVATYV